MGRPWWTARIFVTGVVTAGQLENHRMLHRFDSVGNPLNLMVETKLRGLTRCIERVRRSLARTVGARQRQRLEDRLDALTTLRDRVAGVADAGTRGAA